MSGSDNALRDAADALALLVEPDRLRVVAALALGARTVAAVVDRTGLDARATLRALSRLEAAGLVEQDGSVWGLADDRLRELVQAAAPPAVDVDHGAAGPAAAAVLRVFLRDGRLTQIPAVRAKRLFVLDHVVRVFEPGLRYSEKEVNAALRAFHADYAALRRYLVDEGLMSRESGMYWRSGGTVEI